MFIATFSVNWFIFYVCSYDIFIICFRVILSVATARITLKNEQYLFCSAGTHILFFKNQYFKFTFPFFSVWPQALIVWVDKPVYLKHNAILLFWSRFQQNVALDLFLRYIYTTHMHLFIVTFCCEHFLIFSLFLLKLVFGLTSLFDQIYF